MINAITDAPLYILGTVLAILLPLIIALLTARFRGFFPALFFLPFFIPLMILVVKEIPGFKDMFTQNEILQGVLNGVNAYESIFDSVNKYVKEAFLKIAPENETWRDKIVNQTWFSIALYGFFFVISFSFIHKPNKKKGMIKYDDDF